MAPIGLRIFYRTKLSGDSQPIVRTLCSYDDLSQFNFLLRQTVKDAINFSSDLVAKNIQEGIHSAVEYQGNFVYALCKDNLVVAYVCNEAYNDRVANTLLNKFHDMFISKYPLNTWSTISPNSVDFPQIQTLFEQSKNPVQVDKMEQIKQTLDATTSIMHQNIESLLTRGENLDSLVFKSELLSTQSKQFYKTAKQTNSCCMIL